MGIIQQRTLRDESKREKNVNFSAMTMATFQSRDTSILGNKIRFQTVAEAKNEKNKENSNRNDAGRT